LAHLQTIILSNNLIADDGAKALSGVFGMSPTLQSLELANNRITDNGAQHFVEVFARSSRVIKLDLTGNIFDTLSLLPASLDKFYREIEKDGSLKRFCYRKGTLLNSIKQWELALDSLDQAVRIDPSHYWSLSAKGKRTSMKVKINP